MPAFEDDAGRPILKELRISNGVSKTRPNATKIVPELEDLAIKRKRWSAVIVRHEPGITEMQRLTLIVVVDESRPCGWPRVGGAQKGTDLHAIRITATCVSKDCEKIRICAPLRRKPRPFLTKSPGLREVVLVKVNDPRKGVFTQLGDGIEGTSGG